MFVDVQYVRRNSLLGVGKAKEIILLRSVMNLWLPVRIPEGPKNPISSAIHFAPRDPSRDKSVSRSGTSLDRPDPTRPCHFLERAYLENPLDTPKKGNSRNTHLMDANGDHEFLLVPSKVRIKMCFAIKHSFFWKILQSSGQSSIVDPHSDSCLRQAFPTIRRQASLIHCDTTQSCVPMGSSSPPLFPFAPPKTATVCLGCGCCCLSPSRPEWHLSHFMAPVLAPCWQCQKEREGKEKNELCSQTLSWSWVEYGRGRPQNAFSFPFFALSAVMSNFELLRAWNG